MTHRPHIPPWPARALAVAAVALLPVAGPARAGDDHDLARSLRESGAILPLEQVVVVARERHPGRLLQVELERHGERYVYEVEFVDDEGVVWTMYFDAASGGFIESGRDNGKDEDDN